jgi:HSP20 family molecular chaperone IbpA
LDDIIKELRRRIKEIEDEISYAMDLFPKDDLDEAVLEPLTSIRETPDCIIVTVDMPFVDPDSVEVKLIEGSLLLLEAEMREDIKSSILDSTYPKTTFRKYKKIVKLPSPVKKIIRLSLRGEVLAVYLSKHS